MTYLVRTDKKETTKIMHIFKNFCIQSNILVYTAQTLTYVLIQKKKKITKINVGKGGHFKFINNQLITTLTTKIKFLNLHSPKLFHDIIVFQLGGSTTTTTSLLRRDPLSGVAGFSRREWRQLGQEEWERSHVSMQCTWNPWLHFGSIRTLSPFSNSPRHMGHSVAGMVSLEAPYTATGMRLSSRRFSPVPARRAAACSGVSSPKRRPHRSAHRAMEFSPSAHISAHRSAARMITMLVSKLASLMNVSRVLLPYDGGMLSSVSRNRRCVMFDRWLTPNRKKKKKFNWVSSILWKVLDFVQKS